MPEPTTPSPQELADLLRARARELDFTLFGIAPADPPLHAQAFKSWLEAGHAAEMGYLAGNAERRLDPRLVVLGARSLICVAVSYNPGPLPNAASTEGQIARYARSLDYHNVLLPKLNSLVEHLRQVAGRPVEARAYVDTGPVLERDAAVRAGLGWFGKNTCLIHPRHGSYLLLGAVITDLELPPDARTGSHCGTCSRCLTGCPTGAFVGPYVLDSRRCISYLTIELKGPIPRELRPLIGNWVFGCDICQEVCPHNRKAPPGDWPELAQRPVTSLPQLTALLALTPEEFRRDFRGTPIERTKRRGLLRNVAVALGNSGDPSVVPNLAEALGDAEPLVRGHSAWALVRLGGTQARTALRERLVEETDTYVLEELRLAMEDLP
ncbi:MAG TPA: tRNA epoxyqueuosine(34) reductase QueG [Armatimonadota bacterium]|jgi:epoxyqueuosine reductase